MTLGNQTYKWLGQSTKDIQGLLNYLRDELSFWASFSNLSFSERSIKKELQWLIGNQVIAVIRKKEIFLHVPDYIKDHITQWSVIKLVESDSSPYKGWIVIKLGDDPRQYLRGLLRTAYEFGVSKSTA